jgi:predicted acyl esterase
VRQAWVPLAVLLIASLLGGCLDPKGSDEAEEGRGLDPLSPAQFGALTVEETWVASSVDGKRIHNAVYRPETDEAVPVFINFSPYWGDSAVTKGDAFGTYMVDEYVARGYAIVLSAVRGTGHSEGCFQIGGDLELQDTYDVVDFFSKQPWSNGKVAAGGKSYDSTTQNGMVAKVPHPALEGIFHVSGITDMYRYNYYGGVPYATGPIFNTYYYFQGTSEYGLPVPLIGGAGGGPPGEEGPDSLARVLDDVACTELPQMQLSGVGSGATGMKDEYWVERDWTRFIAESAWDGSIFFVHGFQDWNVKPDNMLPWLANLPPEVKARTLGWLHQWQNGGDGHVYPMRTDWNETMLRWMDHVLKGSDNGMDQMWGFELQSMGEETDQVWTRVKDWPPTVDEITLEGSPAANELLATQPYHLTGGAWAEVTALVAEPQAVLSVRLEKTDGTWVSEGVLRAMYRDGLDTPSLVLPGEPLTYRVDLFPFDLHLAEGKTLRLVTGEMPQYTLATPAELAAVTYQGFVLHLPTSDDSVQLDPQPVPMDCFTC